MIIRDSQGNEIDQNNISLKPIEKKAGVLSDKQQAMLDLANAFIGGTSELSSYADSLHQATTVPEEQWHPPLDNAWRDTAKQAQGTQNVINAGYGSELSTNYLEVDEGARYRALKKATHDYAHQTSAEQGVVDWFKSYVAGFEDDTLITKSEAEQLAKEQGVDLKFEKDKPIKKGALDYAIKRQLEKKELEKQVAYYRSTGDYSALQNICLMGSAISGGIGLYETALTVGLSFLGGEGIAYGLGRLATITGEAGGIIKGVQGAQRAAYAVRCAQNAANIAQEAKIAGNIEKAAQAARTMQYWNKRAQIRKGASFAEKFGYDAYQFGKFTGERGAAASLGSTSAAFAIDGMVGSVLPAMARELGDQATMSGEYSTKDMITEVMAGGAFGAVMPVIGKGFKTGGQRTADILKKMNAERTNAKTVDGLLKSNKAVIEEAEAVGATVEKSIDNIIEAVSDKGNLEAAEMAAAVGGKAQNVSDEEILVIMNYVISELKKGRIPNIDKLPIRNLYYSDIPCMLDTITAHIAEGKPVKDLLEVFEKAGLKIEQKGMGNWRNPMEELRVGALTGKIGTTAKFANETKALGRAAIFGLNQRDANKTLANIYIARMGGDTEAAVQAGIDVENMIEHLTNVRRQLRSIVDTYNLIEHTNDAANKGKGAGYYSYNVQKTMFKSVSDSAFGAQDVMTDLPGAIRNLSHMLLPEDIRVRYQTMKDIADKGDLELSMTHRLTETGESEYHKAKEFLVKVEQWEDDFAKYMYHDELSKNGKYTFHRLNILGEDSGKSQAAFLDKLDQDIEQGIEDIKNIYNTDMIFAEETSDTNKILQRIQDTNRISELDYVYNPEGLSAIQVKDLVSDSNGIRGRLETAKLNFKTYENSDVVRSIKALTAVQEKNMESRIRMGYFYELEQSITNAEKILTDSADSIRNNFLEKIKANKGVQKTLELEGTLNSSTLLRVASEEGKSLSKMFIESIEEVVGSNFSKGALGKEYERLIDDAMDTFTDFLRKNPDEALSTLATPHGFDAERSTTEEIVGSLSASYKQTTVMDNLISGLMNQVADEVSRFEIRKLTEVTNFFDAWSRCLDTKGKMSESILGEITMTWLARKGSSLSIENMSNPATEYKWFLQALDKKEIESGGEKLSEYVLDRNNFDDIRDAVVDYWMYASGKMSQDEEEAFVRTVANTRAGRAAKTFLDAHAGIVQHLNELGSNKTDITRLLNPSKLSRSHSILSVNELKGAFFDNLGGWMHQTKNPDIQKALARFCIDDTVADDSRNAIQKFFNINNNKEQMRTANNALYFFRTLDLDKHFGKGYPTRVSLNALRDALDKGAPLSELIKKYGESDINRAINKIADGILGKESDKSSGLMRKLWTGSRNAYEELASTQSRYINNMEQPLHFKSTEALKDAVRDFGYDDIESWFEASVGNGKRAYAVLRKSGTNPMEFYHGLIDLATTYANHMAVKEHGAEAAANLQESLSKNWIKRVDFAVEQVCGTTTSSMSAGKIVAQSIIRFLSTPMLMKAGAKSLTDYAYQYQYLVTTGMKSSVDIGARNAVYSKLLTSFSRDKKMLSSIYMNQHLRGNILYEMIYNEPINNGMLKKFGNLNEWAPTWMKVEAMSKNYSSFLLDNFAFIGPLTRYNRMNAALNVMESVGDFASHSFDDIAKINDGRLLQTLNRFGITKTEWDDVLSKKVVCSMNDYIAKFHSGETLGELGDTKMFFPELLIDLSDDEVATIMKKQGMAVTADNISNYRQTLVDKASMIVNVSADEMTTIPTARIQGALSLAQDPNSWMGLGLRALTQFQSFGTGVNFYHWGRRLAAHMDPEDPLFNKFLCCLNGSGSTATEMIGFISELALFQYVLNELVSGMAGTRKANTVDGEFKPGNVSEKVIKAYVDQAGLLGPMLDATVTTFERGRGAGGGFSLSVLPSGSTLLGQVSRVGQAATKKSTEGNRAQAIGGALITNAAYYTGLPNLFYTQAGWNFIIGDKLTEWQQGSNYSRYKSNRARNGYVPTWLQHATQSDNLVDMLNK